MQVEARWKEFWHEHEYSDLPWVRSILHNLSEFLPYLFGGGFWKATRILYEESGVEAPPDFDWSSDWTSPGEYLPVTEIQKLPIFRLALAIRAYAYYGLKPKAEDFGLGPDVDEFLEATEQSWFPHELGRDKEMELAIAAALARRKLDYPGSSGGLTPEGLAALARVSRKSVMNLLAPSSGGALRLGPDGHIAIESARAWLLSRHDFRPSIWQQQEEPSAVPADTEHTSVDPGLRSCPKRRELVFANRHNS